MGGIKTLSASDSKEEGVMSLKPSIGANLEESGVYCSGGPESPRAKPFHLVFQIVTLIYLSGVMGLTARFVEGFLE